MLRNRKWFCNKALCSQPQKAAVCIHTCFSRSLGSHFTIKHIFIIPCLYGKNNLPLCLWDLPISLKENKFWRKRQNSKSVSYGLSPSNKPMNGVGKQPWNSTSQMEISHFKKIKLGCYDQQWSSSEERIVLC